jgi:hypothetical protein
MRQNYKYAPMLEKRSGGTLDEKNAKNATNDKDKVGHHDITCPRISAYSVLQVETEKPTVE